MKLVHTGVGRELPRWEKARRWTLRLSSGHDGKEPRAQGRGGRAWGTVTEWEEKGRHLQEREKQPIT